MKGDILERFGKQQISAIEDVTEFVKQQKIYVDNSELDKLEVPFETIFIPGDDNLSNKLGIDISLTERNE